MRVENENPDAVSSGRVFMFVKKICLFMLLAAFITGPAGAASRREEGLFAQLDTSKGQILIRLFYKRAPMTVLNFVSLAEGGAQWTDPETHKQVTRPLYRNLRFHNVRDYMIQTGDPTGTGMGSSGHMFDDEFDPGLRHDAPGAVSMANRGPNTNSSQFFITRKPTPWMNDRYTMFGKVVRGMGVVRAIEPGDMLRQVTIVRKGKQARAFNATRAHELARVRIEALRKAACKKLPAFMPGPVDPARVPKKDQPRRSPGDFAFLVIGYEGMPAAARLGRHFCHDRKGALKMAGRIVRLARTSGIAFADVIKRYTDNPGNTHAEGVSLSPRDPATLEQIFRLGPGQISEPVDLPAGIFIFKRLK